MRQRQLNSYKVAGIYSIEPSVFSRLVGRSVGRLIFRDPGIRDMPPSGRFRWTSSQILAQELVSSHSDPELRRYKFYSVALILVTRSRC